MRKITAADLRAERARALLAQRDVAAEIGISPRALRDWEKGNVELTPEKVALYRAAVARLRQGVA